MVLQKRLYYGFNGFQSPSVPRGFRSVRGKRSGRNNCEQKKMDAFDLLATVAGKLLLEEEFPASDNLTDEELKIPIVSNAIKQEKIDEKTDKVEPCDQRSDENGRFPSITYHKRLSQKFVSKECSQASSSLTAEPSSVVVKPETSVKAGYESAIENKKDAAGNLLVTYHRRSCLQRQSPPSLESHVVKREDEILTDLQIERQNCEDEILTDLLCLEDPLDLDCKTPNLVSSDSSVEVPSCHDNFPGISSFPDNLDYMELVDKDNDENSSRCNHSSTATSNAFKQQRVGHRRIRKLLASKFWKVGPTLLKDGEFSNIDSEYKSIFRSRKVCYRRQRTNRSSFRRKKIFDRNSVPMHCGEVNSEVLSFPSVNSVKKEDISHSAALNGGQKSKFMSENYQVKFSIKSLKLPELFIEMPESATVGELKRTVLETLTSILHNGLRVGIIFQGKKVRDDNKTLLQSGIAQGAKLENLGFSLESNTSKDPQITILNDPCYPDPCDASKPLPWLPDVPPSDMSINDGESVLTQRLEPSNNPDNNLNLVPFADTAWSNTMSENSDALAVVPAVNLKALSVVPTNRKLNRSELVQRRMRRPFSVSEVEALVQAVEKLGTGRWRDVKLRAFDNVNHRTYVDLKDKWKTLVHTARISPQQRRGEPVPQELLDRVLSAHAYWSQHQAKLQNKQQQQSDQCLLI